MKVGDKVWVLCEVKETTHHSVRICFDGVTWFWAGKQDCRPVEPEAAEESKELDSDYRDATPEDGLRAVQGENVRVRFRDYEFHEWISKGKVLDRYQPAGKYRWIDGDGCSWKYCQVYDPKKPQPESEDDPFYEPWEIDVPEPTQYDPPISGLELILDRDTVEPGDMFQSTRDGKFHRCNFTVGMTVEDAVFRGEQQRETWTFYRPKKVQA
jgi:hypothetical protein